MITSYEVGTVFKIVDRATPVVRELTKGMVRLDEVSTKVKNNFRSIGTMGLGNLRRSLSALTEQSIRLNGSVGNTFREIETGTDAATQRTRLLAAEWRNVAAAARQAGTAAGVGSVGRASVPGAAQAAPRAGVIGLGGHGRGAALAGAGMLAYGSYLAAQNQDAVFQLMFHSGAPNTAENRNRFSSIIRRAHSETGMPLADLQAAAIDEIRLLRGTKGKGIDILPELLKGAAVEARAKGTSVDEAMKSIIGTAHMTKGYEPAQIKKLLPAFAFLSSSNSASLGQMEKAWGYAVPFLQSGLEIDPMQTMLLGVALQRAGITNSKSGTWLRAMAIRSLPGTSLMSRTAFKKHEGALRDFGLIDKNDKPTWFTNGKPDLIKMLTIAEAHAQKIPVIRRAAEEKQLFGAQGAGAFAILSDPKVLEQVRALQAEMPEFKNRYATFFDAYSSQSTGQKARQTFADFQNVLMDIGTTTLPILMVGLRDFDNLLKEISGPIGMIAGYFKSGTPGAPKGPIGPGLISGAAIGAGIGAFGGPVGIAAGALFGGMAGRVIGGALGLFSPSASTGSSSSGTPPVIADGAFHKTSYIIPSSSGAAKTWSDIGMGHMAGSGGSISIPTSSGVVKVGKNKVAAITAATWRKAGMSEVGIAGVLGNAQWESHLNPNLRHPDQPHWGGEAHFAHGLYQEGGAEWNHYASWLAKNHPGSNWQNPAYQNEFTAWNLRKNYPKVWSALKSARSPEEAASIFERGYEKPARWAAHSADRQRFARKFFSSMPQSSGLHGLALRKHFGHPHHEAESPAAEIPSQSRDIHVHSTSILDGRVVAQSTMKQIVKMGNGPARGPRSADYSSTRPINV